MRMRSLIMVLALTLIGGAVFAQTVCIPAPGTSTTTGPVGSGPMVTSNEVEMFNHNYVVGCYGISDATVNDLRQRHDWGTIYFIANMAKKTGRPITEIASLAEQGVAWNDIASRYNVAMSDLTAPMCPTTVAMVPGAGMTTAGYGTGASVMPVYITDRHGNIVLTAYDDARLKMRGYSWQDIAIAANIAAQTGLTVDDVLTYTGTGTTWPQIALRFGLNADDVVDTTMYPFPRSSERMQYGYRAPVGAGAVVYPSSPQGMSTYQPMPSTPQTQTSPTSPEVPSTY